MYCKPLLLVVFTTSLAAACAQNTKTITRYQQVWLSYSNITRLSTKWGLMADAQVRTKDHFVEDFSTTITSFGINYNLSEATRITTGYTYSENYADGARTVTIPEHRPFQQVQWNNRYGNKRMLQWIRLEERFRRKVYGNSQLDEGYNFNYRLRYNFFYELPLSRNGPVPHTFSLVLNNELHMNFGRQIVLNTFDQNRFSCGFKYQFSTSNSVQMGYVNLFQQLSAGNKYRTINAGRIAFLQNLDLRRNKPATRRVPVAPQ